MQVEWYGQSAFRLTGRDTTVFIDPFGDTSGLAARGIQFDYPPIEGVSADLLLDHPRALRPQRRRTRSPGIRWCCARRRARLGVAGRRGDRRSPPSTTRRPAPSAGRTRSSSSSSTALSVCHFGDFGQSALRDEQAAAIGSRRPALPARRRRPDDRRRAGRRDRERLGPRWVVPMHYRTPRIGFLETGRRVPRAHAARCTGVEGTAFETDDLPAADGPLAVVPAAP